MIIFKLPENYQRCHLWSWLRFCNVIIRQREYERGSLTTCAWQSVSPTSAQWWNGWNQSWGRIRRTTPRKNATTALVGGITKGKWSINLNHLTPIAYCTQFGALAGGAFSPCAMAATHIKVDHVGDYASEGWNWKNRLLKCAPPPSSVLLITLHKDDLSAV
jgi:hypothetical protein